LRIGNAAYHRVVMGRALRVVGYAVAVALVLPACGGNNKVGSAATDPPETQAQPPETVDNSSAPSTSRATADPVASSAPPRPTELPSLLDGGVVSDAALAAVIAPDGNADPVVLQAFVAEFSALPVDEQIAVIADLSLRTELEAAAISGLEAAVGDRAATEAALVGAWSQVKDQSEAASAAVAQAQPTGFRRAMAAPQASPSGGAVAATGLFLGYMGLATFGQVVTERSNTFKPGDSDVHEGDGTVFGASLDEVSAELTFKGKQDGVDVEFVAGTTIHPCPDPDGAFMIEALIDVKASKAGVGQNARMELEVDGTVDDNAELAGKNIENHTQWSDFGGGKGQFVDFTMAGPNGVEQARTNRTGGTVTDAFMQLSSTLSTLVGLLIATQLLDATEKAWKSGRCVELKVTPSAGPDGLTPSEVVNVLAEPRSKVDGTPTGGTVTATLTSGGASVEPNGSPVPADANSNYTAPNEQDQKGTVSYESRSRRGVGKAEITFSTTKPAAYLIVGGLQDWQVNQVVCDVMQPFTLEAPGVGTAQFSGGLSGTYSATGVFNLHYEGTYQITLENGLGTPGTMIGTSGGSIAGEAGAGSENYTLTPTTC
jgi:hypothetical protein